MEYEKDSKGYLYYAFNNEETNYLKLAISSAITGRYYIDDFRATVITDKHSMKFLNKTNKKLLEKIFGNIENCLNCLNSKENNNLSLSDIIDKNNLKILVNFSTKKVASKKRKGQEKFRNEVLKNFKSKCAVCGISQIGLLQAGHIIQINDEKKSGLIQNGICFCMTCHKLFDEGYFSFDDKYKIIFSKDKEIDPILKKIIRQKSKIGKCLILPSSTFLLYHRIKFKIF